MADSTRFFVMGTHSTGRELYDTRSTKVAAVRLATRLVKDAPGYSLIEVRDTTKQPDDGHDVVWCYERSSGTVDPTGMMAWA